MKKLNFKEVVLPAIILFAICLVITAALALTNSLTEGPIAKAAAEKAEQARRAVLNGTAYELISDDGNTAVWAVLVTEAELNGAQVVAGETDGSPSDITKTDMTNSDLPVSTEQPAELVICRPWDPSEYGSSSQDEAAADTPLTNTDLTGTDLTNTDLTNTDLSQTDVSGTDIAAADSGYYIIGYVVTTSAKGYGGDIEIMVGIDLNMQITGITILSNSETPGLGANCTDEYWLAQFTGKSGQLAVNKDGGEIDALTSATITSRAVTEAVNQALAAAETLEGGRVR